MIELKNIVKTFGGKDSTVHAVNNISLTIEDGDIFGIIGLSGAGKSTLIRTINLLERPDSGSVVIDGVNLTDLTDKELRGVRKQIGMIFQHFNLFQSRTVYGNIAFPLKGSGMSKAEIKARVNELIKLVELDGKEKSYPSQLSGGQQQRVAIARALANNPKILLCDEATSALDPQTTRSILSLLKKINEETNITVVIITHQMSVISQICNRVAVIEKGVVVEEGSVAEVFSHPKAKATKELILHEDTSGDNQQNQLKEAQQEVLKLNRIIRIVFTEASSFEPIIANCVLEAGVPVNILRANTRDVGGVAKGEMLLGLPEDETVANKIIDYLRSKNLDVEEVTDDVE